MDNTNKTTAEQFSEWFHQMNGDPIPTEPPAEVPGYPKVEDGSDPCHEARQTTKQQFAESFFQTIGL